MKVASTVRRGAVGKVPKGNSLAAYPTMEQFTKPVEGQNDGQDTAGHSAASKLRVGLEAPYGSQTASRLPSVQGTHAKLTQAWKRPLL